jgi:FMN-dependent NADH-azoreductase
MSSALVLNTSIAGGSSVSRVLVDDVVAALRASDPSLRVVERDLGSDPVPHLSGETIAAFGRPTTSAPSEDGRTLSETLVDELKAADVLVIGAPMYNFGIPSSLKAWFDHVLRAGITFRYTEAGPEGLITGTKAIVVETRGGLYSEGPAAVMDSQEPHLRTMLGFMGITDVTFVRAEKLAFGPEVRDQAIVGARAELARIAGEIRAAA